MKIAKTLYSKKNLDINFAKKPVIFAIVTLLIVSSVNALNIHSQDEINSPSRISKSMVWNVTLTFTETGGKNDYVVFGEADNASDGLDSYDGPNPPSSPEPFLDAYFTTDFPWPHNTLLQEIKKYPDTYKEWNFTVWWTGSDTTVTISWNTADVDDSEYDSVMLCNSIGTPLVDMLASNNYMFFCSGSAMISFQIIATANAPPILSNPFPANGSMGVERPPSELSITVEDPDEDAMDVYIMWKNHTDDWLTLQTYTSVGDGSYNFIPPEVNDWIWGNTTYYWSGNATDPSGSGGWTNETYQFTTRGSRYDVNNNGRVNFQDAGLVWVHRTSEVDYDGIYDVDQNGEVNFQDAGLTWVNRD